MFVPASIPGYRLVRELGRGGMAQVWLATQESLGREVALKLLAPHLAADPTAAERFLREARVAAKLAHRHIVGIHDVGIHDGQPYIAMEYMPGGPVSADVPHSPSQALGLVREVALALDHAHRDGVIHRDIKPENILRRGDGTSALADFGIARAADADTSPLTREGTTVGTPLYMSPEQLQGLALDGRSDLYSLGVVLYQLLTGELPYRGTDGVPVGMQHVHAPIPRLPRALARYQSLLDEMLAKQPSQRPATGAEVARRIEALLSGPVATLPALAVAASPRRRQQAWLVAGAGVLLATGTGWYFATRSAPEDVASDASVVSSDSPTDAPASASAAELDAAADAEYRTLLAEARRVVASEEEGAYEKLAPLQGFIERHPGFREGTLQLGWLTLHFAMADPEGPPMDALTALAAEARTRWPGSPEARTLALMPDLALCLCSARTVRLAEVMKELTALADASPDEPMLQGQTALGAMSQGDYDTALRYAQRHVDLAPKDTQAQSRLAEVLLALGRFDEAETTARRVVAIDPRAMDGYGILARIGLDGGRYTGVLDAVEACQRAGVGSRCRNLLIPMYRRLRQDDLADTIAKENNPEGWARIEALRAAQRTDGYRGVLAWIASHGEEAEDYMERYRWRIAIAASLSGEYDAALEHYRQSGVDMFLSDEPIGQDQSERAIQAGIALHRLGRTQEAQALFERVRIGVAGRFDQLANTHTTYSMVAALAWLGREDEAMAALRRSVQRGWHDDRYLLEWTEYFQPDPATEPLRDREDFQELIRSVQARNAAAFARLEASGRDLLPDLPAEPAAGAAAP